MQSKPSRWYEYVLNISEGMTAKEVADRAHFDQSAMTRWKNGLNVDPKFAVQFARAFNQNVLHALAEAGLITEAEADLHEVKIGLDEVSTQQLLEELARRIDHAPSRRQRAPEPDEAGEEDPDYSNLSDQDAYDLASKKGEPDIGHDESPHEP